MQCNTPTRKFSATFCCAQLSHEYGLISYIYIKANCTFAFVLRHLSFMNFAQSVVVQGVGQVRYGLNNFRVCLACMQWFS